jgi:NADH:ubiquinone reductase (H+-translocating)
MRPGGRGKPGTAAADQARESTPWRSPGRPRVVVVGGGFGGLNAARALKRAPVEVTLIDRRNHHLFQPLLYQVATAALSPADIAAPIRHVLRKQRNASVVLGSVVDVDPGERHVVLASGSRIPYEFLILATGAVDQYFGNEDWAKSAPGLKKLEDAVEIRRRFLLAFEAAEQERDPELCRALLTFVVVGGGPTGVEMAGAFAEVARHTLTRGDFRRVDPASARIILIEGGPRLLSAYPERLSGKARQELEKLGVEVRLDSMVTRIGPEAVWVGDTRIPTRNVVWSAGVAASPLGGRLDGAPTDRLGRLEVEPDLSVPGHPDIFAIGDLAAFPHQTGSPLPGIAPVAIQQGKAAAESIRRSVAGAERRPFHYSDRGSLATIGRGAAVGEIAGWGVDGILAWLIWLFVHLMYLVGFRNRAAVLLEWAWSYVTWQRGARLITGEIGPVLAPPEDVIGAPPRHAGPP